LGFSRTIKETFVTPVDYRYPFLENKSILKFEDESLKELYKYKKAESKI
jgi:hypothetical protein